MAIGPVYSVAGAVLLWIAHLSSEDELPRNGSVGIRTPATKASDAAWYAAHRAGAWSIALAGLVFLGVGMWLLWRRPVDTRRVVLVSSLIVMAIVVIGGIQADQVARGVTG